MAIHIDSAVKCYNHPHRLASGRCGRCAIQYCEECLVQIDGQSLCPSCRRELQTARQLEEEAQVPLGERIRRSLVRATIWIAVIGIIIGGAWFVGTKFLSRPLTEEEMNRIRDAFEMQMGDINWLSAHRGGQVVRVSSQQPGYEASLLLDRLVGEQFKGWRSASATFPQEIVFAMPTARPLRAVRVMAASDASPDSWARLVEVYRATGADGPWVKIGSLELPNEDSPEIPTLVIQDEEGASSPLGGAIVQYIKVVVLSNWGDPSYTSLGDVQVSGL